MSSKALQYGNNARVVDVAERLHIALDVDSPKLIARYDSVRPRAARLSHPRSSGV